MGNDVFFMALASVPMVNYIPYTWFIIYPIHGILYALYMVYYLTYTCFFKLYTLYIKGQHI